MCRLFPSVAPHGPHVANSVWRVDWTTWLGVARAVDMHVKAMKDAETERQRQLASRGGR